MHNKGVKLDPEIKKAWLEALRSGKYKQGRMALQFTSPSGEQYHCCLGVLNEVVPVESKTHKTGSYLSLSTCNAANLAERYQCRLAKLNDQYHLSFAQIAEIIERVL